MSSLLAWLQKHLVWSIPGAMVLGLAFGALADARALGAAILPLTLLMVYPMMVSLKLGALAAPGHGRLHAVALAINFVLMPLVGWAAGQVFFPERPALQLALLLTALLLPLVVVYALNFAVATVIGRALFARGDATALVYGTVMRNLSIALAMAIGVFREQGAEAALLIALAYVVQVQAAAWYVRLTPRVFGPAPPMARPAAG